MGRQMTIQAMRDVLHGIPVSNPEQGIVARALGAMSGVWSREGRVRTVGQWLDETNPKSDVRHFVKILAGIE